MVSLKFKKVIFKAVIPKLAEQDFDIAEVKAD